MQIVNNSGWRPVGRAVLLRAFELAELAGKQGAIVIPDSAAMSSATCDTLGIVVAHGPDCWTGENETTRAKIGDKVMFTKFTGGVIKGSDGYIYRMIPDHAIYAVLDEEKANG